MRSILMISSLLAAGVAWGNANDLRQEIRDNGTASAAYIQDAFLARLQQSFAKELGPERAGAMLEFLQKSGVELSDVLDIVNGRCSDKDLARYFGARPLELVRARKGLEAAVADKDKGAFFGILADVMLGDFGLDPTGDFCRQACLARDEVSPETMEKLLKGSRSKGTIQDAFGFRGSDDIRFMRKIVNRISETPYIHHPMYASIEGLHKKSKFDRRRFARELTENMAGFGKFQDGLAGGVPYDRELPPVPFFGENLNRHFAVKKR